MKIIYPPLVEEGYAYCIKNGIETTKEAVFLNLVEKNILHENGEPTPQALQNGLVKDFTEPENLSFAEFLALYPVFEKYAPENFQRFDGFWEMNLSLKHAISCDIDDQLLTEDELIQITAYFTDRK